MLFCDSSVLTNPLTPLQQSLNLKILEKARRLWMDLFDFVRKLRPQQPLPAESARYFFPRTSLYCKHQRVYLSLPRSISTRSLSASRWLDPP